MPKNNNLQAAKKAKNDEFYTQYSDIEKELQHYTRHFAGKVIYCNCDNPEWSNFWKYFHENFTRLKLKKLIASFYDPKEPAYYMEYNGGNDNNCEVGVKTPLQGNGDFRSPECIELLKEADIVVTNPPFSIARSDYLPQLMEYEKKFIIIGDLNWVTYKSIFPLIKDNKIWMGYNSIKQFLQPDGTMAKFGNKLWYTNLDIPKRHEPIDLIEHYFPERYPRYDNYDAINVDKTLDIPCDYDGVMGVPISFLDKYCPEQFEIIGLLQSSTEEQAGIPILREYNDFKEMRQDGSFTGSSGGKANGNPVLPGKSAKGNFLYNPVTNEYVHSAYARILIRKVKTT